MKRLMEKMVFLGLVIAWRRATWPTSRSPSLVNATTLGVVRPPSELGMTTGSPPSITATTELVVPRSMPMTLSAIATSSVKSGGAHYATMFRPADGGNEGKSRTHGLRQVGSEYDGIGYISDASAPARPMIPLSDENPTLHTPIMTWALLAVMFAAFVLVQGAGFNEIQLATSICNYGMVPGELTHRALLGTGVPIARGLAC